MIDLDIQSNHEWEVSKAKDADLERKEKLWLLSMLGSAFLLYCLWLVLESFSIHSFSFLFLALVLTLIGLAGGVYYSERIEKH